MNTQTLKFPQSAKKQVRILIVDDHEVMRLGMRNLLESRSDWSICGEAADGRQAIEKALQLHPDVIIMDITMPGMNGLEAANQIARTQPEIPIILFSLHLSEDVISHFQRDGIRGAVSKGDAARDLVEAVEIILAGGTFFSSKKSANRVARSAEPKSDHV